MKRILFTLAFALLATVAFAQSAEPGPPHEGMDHMHRMSAQEHAKHLTKELGLSSEQAAKVHQIFAAQQQKHEAEMAAGENLTPEQRRAQFMAARKDVDAQIEAVLTDAQKQKFAQLRSRMKEHRGQQPNAQQPPPPDQQ